MSGWKELPRPATEGPWEVEFQADEKHPHGGEWIVQYRLPPTWEERRQNAYAAVALPEYVAALDHARAWVEYLVNGWTEPDVRLAFIQSGEWPDGRER